MRIGILLCCMLAFPARSDSPPDFLQGRWLGAAIFEGTPRVLELEFSLSDGALTTALTLPYSGYNRFPYAFEYADGALSSGLFGDEMRLHVDAVSAQLRGTVVEDGQVTATVFLQKVPAGGGRPYAVHEVGFDAGGDELAGSLYLPEGAGPHPVIVHVAGRSYGDRGQMSEFAAALAPFGIAGLAFDGRGTGRSTGDNGKATGADRLADIEGAIEYLQGRDDIDRDRIGLLSNSAGAWLVPEVATRRGDVAFLITLVGPAESLAKQQGRVINELMRRSDKAFDDQELTEAFAYQKRLVELAGSNAPWSAFEPLIEAARETRWGNFVDLPASLDNSELDYFRRRPDYDPEPALRQLEIPFLAIFGEEDWVVPPSVNVQKLQEALEAAGNEDFEILVLPGADHGLALPRGTIGEGAWPERRFQPWNRSPWLYTTLVRWLVDRGIGER